MSTAAKTMAAEETFAVNKELVVEVPQERAFRVFTERFDAWWPREHHIARSPMKQAVLEARQGGSWYELGEDGTRCDWGKVLVWEPPERLVLAWQINGQWQYDPSLVTEVEVRFTPQGPQRTHVTLEHRCLEKMGATAAQMKGALGGDGGWGRLLKLFAGVAEQPA